MRRVSIDVQALTCAQLAGTFQEDADLLTTWYSGWYNGLAKRHFINLPRSREAEHLDDHLLQRPSRGEDYPCDGGVFDKMRAERGIDPSK